MSGYHLADGHAIELMGIGHYRHMPDKKGEIGEISGLFKGPAIHIVKPEFGGEFLTMTFIMDRPLSFDQRSTTKKHIPETYGNQPVGLITR